jgi:hypothetical protein
LICYNPLPIAEQKRLKKANALDNDQIGWESLHFLKNPRTWPLDRRLALSAMNRDGMNQYNLFLDRKTNEDMK